jgi:anti-sigma factor RsiW
MSACPDKELLLHALADNELDAGNAAALEAHVATCASCAAELAAIREVKARVGATPAAYTAPQSLRDRLDAAIAAETAPPPRRRAGVETWVMSGAIGALAASLAALVLLPTGATLESQLVDAQARSLEAQHLVDVETSDRHTVKPWFNGKLDFAPPVVDLKDQGFPLVGGRLDRLDGRRVAALVFHRGPHTINLFIWPGAGPTAAALEQKTGYNLVRWSQAGLTFWAVSDCDASALQTFQKAFAAATS